MGLFQICTKVCGDIRNFVFVAGINDTGDKLLTGVSDTGDNTLSRVHINSMTPVINLSPVTTTLAKVIAGNNDTGDNLSLVTATEAINYHW